MKAQEVKYLFLLQGLEAQPASTQANLARLADMPTALANRYLRRLAAWKMLRRLPHGKTRYPLTSRGKQQLYRASWEWLASAGDIILNLHDQAVRELAAHVATSGARRAVLYGATPLAETLRAWAAEAGLAVVGLCDEERHSPGSLRLTDLATIDYDCIILSDWQRAGDQMLIRLLSHYAPVINLFAVDGAATPDWS